MEQPTDNNWKLAHLIVRAIVRDLIGRKGLENIWEEIDEGTRYEILTRWEEIVHAELAKERV